MRTIGRSAIVLTIICVVAGVALAASYAATSPIIAEQQERALQESLLRAFPSAERFTVNDEVDDVSIYEAWEAEELRGYVVVTEEQGYGGSIELAVGVDLSGTVVAPVQVIGHTETPGLGSRITQDWFREQFEGKDLDSRLLLGEDVEALAGATVSANAVSIGVNSALREVSSRFIDEGIDTDVILDEIDDGVYMGSGLGFGGDIRVEVEIKDGRLIRVQVVEHSETPYVAGDAVEEVPKSVEEKQDLDVDVWSGATATTEGIIEAIESALASAGIQEDELDIAEAPDGVYRGRSAGYGGTVTVEIEIADGELVRLDIVDHYELPDYIAEVLDEIPQEIMEKQQIEVDAYSGATETTEAIVEAVRSAVADSEDPDAIDFSELEDGVYRGESVGYGGSLTVEIEVADGDLIRLDIVDHYELPEHIADVLSEIPQEILQRQEIDVDAYSGATETTVAIIEAIKESVDSSGEPDEALDFSNVPDGTYTAEAEGFGGPLEVEAEFADGSLQDVRILAHEDTPELAEPALENLIRKMREQQTPSIDTETGATITSEALIEAIYSIMKQTKLDDD